ncbi:hypothetical protein [Methylobacterium oxalidis]|uniref:hypothetical protein n=1 Tax=Methylobacterium oxalidis TaxID=944322 RepID=UPI003315A1ED
MRGTAIRGDRQNLQVFGGPDAPNSLPMPLPRQSPSVNASPVAKVGAPVRVPTTWRKPALGERRSRTPDLDARSAHRLGINRYRQSKAERPDFDL